MAMARQNVDNDHSASSPCVENHLIRKSNTKVLYEKMPGFRFNSNLLFCLDEQQFYMQNGRTSTKNGRSYYTCYVNGCTCTVQIRNEECYIGNSLPHRHDQKTDMYLNLCAFNEMRRIVHLVGNQLSAKQVFDDVVKW